MQHIQFLNTKRLKGCERVDEEYLLKMLNKFLRYEIKSTKFRKEFEDAVMEHYNKNDGEFITYSDVYIDLYTAGNVECSKENFKLILDEFEHGIEEIDERDSEFE